MASLEETALFCERCGQNFLPRQSVCTRCGEIAGRHWLQLISLSTLVVAFAGNALIGWFLLPQRAALQPARFLFRAWLWVDDKISIYGWIPLAVGLLAWDFFIWTHSRPKIKGWVTRKILTFALLASVAPFIPSWIPAGQPSQNFLTVVRSHPGLPSALAWGVVVFVITLLSINGETRDSLLGHGRILSVVSLGLLLLLLALTFVGWAYT
jgi:hypothetical protein